MRPSVFAGDFVYSIKISTLLPMRPLGKKTNKHTSNKLGLESQVEIPTLDLQTSLFNVLKHKINSADSDVHMLCTPHPVLMLPGCCILSAEPVSDEG